MIIHPNFKGHTLGWGWCRICGTTWDHCDRVEVAFSEKAGRFTLCSECWAMKSRLGRAIICAIDMLRSHRGRDLLSVARLFRNAYQNRVGIAPPHPSWSNAR